MVNARVLEENRHMIDEERFKKMTKKPIFVNNDRSNLVDTNALVQNKAASLRSAFCHR